METTETELHDLEDRRDMVGALIEVLPGDHPDLHATLEETYEEMEAVEAEREKIAAELDQRFPVGGTTVA